MPISIIILFAVFALIAVRHIGRFRFQIWHVMLGGALAVLLTGQISAENAILSINLDVIFFLFGMFVVGEALEESGYLAHLSFKVFKRSENTGQLVLLLICAVGFFSTFLMNDTLAIIGTPLVLGFSKKHNISAKMLLLALAFSVTIGSVMSPIGNPQNLLVAIDGGIQNQFVTFFVYLAIPTIINFGVIYLLLRLYYRKEFTDKKIIHEDEPVKDKKLSLLCKVSLILILILVAAKIISVLIGVGEEFRLTYIALIAAAPILIVSEKRFSVLKNVDWPTLVFFAAMFVLMASVWESNFFQNLIADMNLDITAIPVILLLGILLSQLISNVPMVALTLPLLMSAGVATSGLMALAAGSTIAGNMLILGAASDVIIIQNAEKRGETLTFWEFARIGIPLTIINALIYWLFLTALN